MTAPMTVPAMPKVANYAARTRGDFERQTFMNTLGVVMARIEPGHCELRLPSQAGLRQQHGHFHGGVITALADVAGGYAAFTLLPAEHTNVTAELKLNFLAPARSPALVAVGSVLKPGRSLSVCRCEVFAEQSTGERVLCAAALASYMRVQG